MQTSPLSDYQAYNYAKRRSERMQMYPAPSVLTVTAETQAEKAPFHAVADADAVLEKKAHATAKRGREEDEENEKEEEAVTIVEEEKKLAPEPPLTRYNAFGLSRLTNLLQRGLSREGANRAIGAEWMSMSDAAHARWQTIADADVARFEREMEAFELAGGSNEIEA
jgi:hypothetical protein